MKPNLKGWIEITLYDYFIKRYLDIKNAKEMKLPFDDKKYNPITALWSSPSLSF